MPIRCICWQWALESFFTCYSALQIIRTDTLAGLAVKYSITVRVLRDTCIAPGCMGGQGGSAENARSSIAVSVCTLQIDWVKLRARLRTSG